MNLHHLNLVTIIGESVLKDKLTRDIKACGAKGYTVMDVEGEGSRHLRAGEIPGQNIRIDVIVTKEKAEAILEKVAKHYFPSYAVIAYVQEVTVVRGDKYV